MVERSIDLDIVFYSLADKTRRDILKRVSAQALSISALAKPYKMSFAAIAKHVGVLEKAKLVTKRREGKQQIISAAPETIKFVGSHLEEYEKMWNERFDALDALLKKTKKINI